MRLLKSRSRHFGSVLLGLVLSLGGGGLPSPIAVQAEAPTAAQLHQQGNDLYRQQQLAQAIRVWQQARSRYRQAGDRAGEAQVLANLGAAYTVLDRYREAVAVLEDLRPLAADLPQRRTEAMALSNLGIAYRVLGRLGDAIAAQKQAARLFYQVGDRPALGQVLANLGNAFEMVGDYGSARTAYEQSLRLARERGDRARESIVLSNLGNLEVMLGQYAAALTRLRQSLRLSEALGHQAAQASTHINLGLVQHAQGEMAAAIQSYQRGLALARAAGDRRREFEALGSLGLVHDYQQRYTEALQFHRQALTLARSLGDVPMQAKTHNNLGHVLLRLNRLAAAEQELRTAIALLDQVRGQSGGDRYIGSIFDTQVHSYSLLQQILVAAGRYEAALEAAEAGRARAFARLLATRQTQTQPLPTTPTLDRLRQVARTQNATLVEYAIVPDDAFVFRGKQRARGQELHIWVVSPQGEIAFEKVDLRSLWAQNQTLHGWAQASRCGSGDFNCQLTALAGQTPAVATGGRPSTRSAAVNFNLNAQQDAQSGDRDAASPPPNPALQRLHQLLIAPIVPHLPTDPAQRVVFIPHEALFLVPFPALRDAEGRDLIERHTILTAPSIQVLGLTQTPPKSSQTATQPLIVGNPVMPSVARVPGGPVRPLDPLPGAEQEARDIARLFQTQPLIGPAATKATVLQQLPQARLIHLATHGLLEYGSTASLQGLGIPGAIALAPAPGDDGLLTAAELLNLPHRLQADLVVLSACDTGQGRITGDGVVGLSRSWLAAGASSVLVSLWAVPDAPTAELMVAFYENLQQHGDKARALRQAMLTVKQNHPEPLNWAAFTLIGQAE